MIIMAQRIMQSTFNKSKINFPFFHSTAKLFLFFGRLFLSNWCFCSCFTIILCVEMMKKSEIVFISGLFFIILQVQSKNLFHNETFIADIIITM